MPWCFGLGPFWLRRPKHCTPTWRCPGNDRRHWLSTETSVAKSMGDRSKISIEMDDTLQELEVYQSLGLPHYLKSPETQIQHHFKHKNNFNFLKDMPFQTCFSCFFNGWLFPKIWKSDGKKAFSKRSTPSGWSFSCTRRAKGKPLRPRWCIYVFIRTLYIYIYATWYLSLVST